jgi:hypothetical protein
MDPWIIFDSGAFLPGGAPGPAGFNDTATPEELERWLGRALKRGWARIEITVTDLLDDPREAILAKGR